MHRGTESRTQIRGARGDVTQVVIVCEGADLLNLGGRAAKAVEYGGDVSAWLHGDNAQLVLFVDPDEEGLGIVVEDTTATGPVTVQVASLKEAVALLEQEVIVNQLLLRLLVHAVEWVKSTLKVIFEVIARLSNFRHYLKSLLFAYTGTKRVTLQITANANSCGIDHGRIFSRELGVLKTLRLHL